MQFQWNFTGLICSLSPCAYCTGYLVEWFGRVKRCFFCVLPDTQKLVRTTPHKQLVQFYPNFTGMISTKSSCALSVCLSVRLSQNLSLLLLINYWGNFILTLQEFMSPLLRSLLRLSQNLSQHKIGHHEATHVITDRSCL
jgi:hypothetical protein